MNFYYFGRIIVAMRKTTLVFTLIFSFGLLCHGQLSPLQQKAITLVRVVQLNHYSPRPVNDSFSLSLFNSLMKIADPRLLLFTQSEYKQLSTFSLKFDDELQGKSSGGADLFISLYKKALTRADSIVNKITQKPFDFNSNESITATNEKNVQYSLDAVGLANKWTRYLKLLALTQAYNAMKAETPTANDLKSYLTKNESSIRQKVKLIETRNFKKILEHPAGFDNYVSELYLNAVASTFDPHTNYFSAQGKDNFKAGLSSESLSFGFDMDENEKGQIIISELVPGGPAWKSGELHQGDEILQMQWDNKNPIDVNGLTIEEVYEIIEQSSNDIFRLKFKKQTGVIKEVTLRKEKMDNEENIVKSFILEGKKKIGYILLPGFYTEWENETGSSCANDVAKEIIKLKREKIDGLILDVRYNGGGSIVEALEMAGIFIEEGPMAAIKEKTGKVSFLKDPNRGTIYDGPFVLMVNGQSASASEMLAATLQDYNRAVIVGSNTYGKATAQQMYLLDSTSTKPSNGSADKDMVKITNSKLYRVNGHSAQLNGVISDVPMIDIFEGLEFGEKFEPNALRSDTIKKNNFYQPLSALPISELSRLSTGRIIKSKGFLEIKELVTEISQASQFQSKTFPLQVTAFQKWIEEEEKKQSDAEGKADMSTTEFKVTNHGQDKELLKQNEYARQVNDVWIKNLSEDIYLEEAFFIITDLINLQTRK